MHNGMFTGWGMGLGFIFWIAIFVLIAFGLVWLARSLSSTSFSNGQRGSEAPLDLLNEQYARGEIDREEYLQKKRDPTA